MDQPQQTAFEKDVLEGPVLLGERRSTSNTSFLELPIDFPRSPAILYQVNHVFFSLPSYCWRALKQICNQQNTTPFTALLATYNTLLFRYTKQEDIVIGSPTPENTFDEEGELPGFHYNTKLFRTDLSGNPRFDELLKRVHQTVLTVNGNKDISYETLEESMRLKMGANYPGLYNITFSYKNAEFENNKINDLAANINLPENYRGNIDLALSVKETTKGLKGVWTYNSGLFKTATIKRLAKHFEVLLQSIVSNPEQTISQLQLLTSTEINQLTFEWNSSTVNYPANKCIHELFEEQVEKTPGATALVFENERLTYAELNERANQLAAHLCKKGVRQETLVPICIGRSLEMIIGILAILKAGGVYVPIDPDYPTERITYLLEDTRASLVVCGKKSKTQLQAFHNIDLVELSNEGYFLKNEPTDNLNINLSSNNLAYVIYTSGSTGKPKGVMIEHRALIDHCYGVIESANLSTCKSFALFSPLVFDAGHSIIHSSLIIGACLHVLSDDIIMSSEKIATYFDNNDIDCIKIVPSLWLSYANLKKTVLPKKIVIFGGEAFPLSILNYFGKLNFRGNIYNHYGPTEITIGKCIYKVHQDKAYYSVPIGKPFSNTQLYIVDDHFQLTPVGIEGELYVAGDGLARGYLNKPGLTAEKFIPNPFTANSSLKMYKTGDKVRWLNDGNIEYIGRADDQVKIQGHRIELVEIEDALLQSELVWQAVVLAIADKKGNKGLAAYIIPAKPFNKEAIAAFLRKKLPEYMIPAMYIELENIPLTVNGKINKKELENLAEINKKYIAPNDDIEAELAAIWEDLLNIERISIHDNFFELGGNSIDAVLLFEKIKKKFNKNLPLATIVNAPTIYKLAIELKVKKEVLSLSSSLVPVQPNGLKTPLFTVHAGGGDILFYQNLSLHLGLDQPFYALQAKGITGTELPFFQMEQMANYYISEIRKVQPEGPYYLAGYCLGARIVFEMAQQLTREGQKVGLLANFNGISSTYHDSSNINSEINEASKNWHTKASHHFNNIAKLSLNGKVSYIYEKLSRQILNKLRKLYFVTRFKLHGLIFRLYLFFKQKVPGVLVRRYVGNTLGILQYKYKPKPYQGSMIVFRSPDIYKDPYLGWKSFVKGEIKTFDIPGMHKTRRDIMNEPHVQILARELKNFLDN